MYALSHNVPAGTHLIEVDAMGYFFSPVGTNFGNYISNFSLIFFATHAQVLNSRVHKIKRYELMSVPETLAKFRQHLQKLGGGSVSLS